jgi:hypothetical protein
MHPFLPVLADASATIHYKLARLQAFAQGQWWHWLALAAIVIGVTTFAVWMYRKDSVELPRGLAVLLCLLRLFALAGILFYFFGLEKRAERKLVKNSRAILLIDTSQSMGLRDPADSGGTATTSRVEQIASELASGDFVERLREKHDVVAYRFDQAQNPVEIASFPRKPTAEEIAQSQVSEEDRLKQLVAESRWLLYVAAGLFVASLLAGVIYLATGGRSQSTSRTLARSASEGRGGGEPQSWALLVTMTASIAALVLVAVACLRASEAGPLAVLGLRAVHADQSTEPSATMNSESAPPKVDWATELSPRGAETRIGDNLRFLIDKERGGPIAAILLFTDAGNNAGSDPKVAAVAAGDALIPLYPVGLGSDKRPPNLRVVDLEAPERVYPGDKFSVTGYVQAQNYSGAGLSVELLSSSADGSGETKEDEQTLDVGRSGQVVPIKFELKPEEQGIRQYKLRVRPFEGEIDRRDNEKTAKVEIIDRRTKVLLVAGGPMRDFIFLRNQLFRDKEVISDVWLQSGKPGISQEAHEILYKFPETADELFEYDAIVAFDPDWDQLDELQVKLLERWVAEKAGGLIIVTGPVFTPQWSSRPRRGDPRIDTLKALYPVVFYYQGSATLNLGRFGSEKAWPLDFTPDGKQAEFLWLDDSADASERAWNQFGGVSGYYAVKDFKPGARVYARFGDPDTAIDNVQPIYMAGQYYGSGRVFFMASGEMWRLRAVDDAYFEQFYTKLIRWVSEGRLLRDSSRGVLLVDKDRAALGDQIAVRAILQDAQHRPLTADHVQASIVQPDATRLPLALKKVKDEGREGIYVEQFTALQEGDYRVELQHPAAAEQLLTREVRVKIPAKEMEFPERNDALLKDLADKSGGEYFVGMPAATSAPTRSVSEGRLVSQSEQGGLAARIKPQDQVTTMPGTPDRQFERQLMGWLLGFICGALCLEWLLRRLSKLA